MTKKLMLTENEKKNPYWKKTDLCCKKTLSLEMLQLKETHR